MIDEYYKAIYTEGGRSWPFVDCYGLVMRARRDIGLPAYEYSEIPTKATKLTAPEHGAIALCYYGSMVRHAGIVLDICGRLEVMDIANKRGVIFSHWRRHSRQFIKVEYFT